MNPKSAIAKGKLLEDHVAKRLRELGLDIRADRQAGSGNGLRKGDIVTDIGVTIECKNVQRLNFNEAAKQVQSASMGYQNTCIVFHPQRVPLEDSVAIIPLEDYLSLLKFKKDHQGREQILDKYQIKNHL